jgi:plasmid stabilization system protein ParE
MNNPTFEFHPEALLEAWGARHWYAERNAQTASAFLAELEHAQEQVITFPDRWPAHVHGTRRYRFRRFPYVLVYHATPQRVTVLAVAHSKRRPGYWKTRLPSHD